LPPEQWDDDARAAIGGGNPLNIFGTLARHPKLMKRWLVFGNHVLGKNTLPARDRELLILRTGWRCAAPYEWGQHVAIGRASGITDAEIERIAVDDFTAWTDNEVARLHPVEELHVESCVG